MQFNETDKRAWSRLQKFEIVFLKNKKAETIHEILYTHEIIKCYISLKIQLLGSHLHFSPENMGAVSYEHGKRFHQDILHMERGYKINGQKECLQIFLGRFDMKLRTITFEETKLRNNYNNQVKFYVHLLTILLFKILYHYCKYCCYQQCLIYRWKAKMVVYYYCTYFLLTYFAIKYVVIMQENMHGKNIFLQIRIIILTLLVEKPGLAVFDTVPPSEPNISTAAWSTVRYGNQMFRQPL